MSITADRKAELITEHKRSDNDTGSAEVQVSILSERIANLTEHFKTHKKDNHSRRGLLKLVSARRSLLDHLKTSDADRYQKLIEESPSPAVTPEVREKMGRVAVAGAKGAGYHNAGTIEFLFDPKDSSFYFMEMNTRIQVEHPVTEMVTGIDLVRAQIMVAAGEKLEFSQKSIMMAGHSIECRINAEDPFNDFRPSPGTITDFHLPGGMGVRVDTHCYSGYQVPPNYDSMIAKLIVHAPTREFAIQRMLRALDEFVIVGVKTTIPLHKKILQHPLFVKGQYSTKFLEQHPEIFAETPNA